MSYIIYVLYHLGAEVTFRAYGVTCLILLIMYALGNFFLVDRGTFTYGGSDNHAILEEDEDDNQCHLAPHGVPSGMARDLSSSKLHQDGKLLFQKRIVNWVFVSMYDRQLYI